MRIAAWQNKYNVPGGKRMTERKRHSKADILAKLGEADTLIAQGTRQRDVARALGISVMTFHRWRKARSATFAQSSQPSCTKRIPQVSDSANHDQLAELQLENLRLRRLLTDALLEKIKLEEALPRPGLNGELVGHAPH
jgi:putative transposase